MSEIVETMLRESVPALLANDRRAMSDIASRDDAVDVLHDAIKRYVTEVTRESLSEEDRRRLGNAQDGCAESEVLRASRPMTTFRCKSRVPRQE